MDARLKARVRRRAKSRCEYCLFPERLAELRFQFDHIIARQHGGATTAANLALACFRCNSHKGPNLSGVDPISGRATIGVLEINRPDAVLLRAALLEEGVSFAPAH